MTFHTNTLSVVMAASEATISAACGIGDVDLVFELEATEEMKVMEK